MADQSFMKLLENAKEPDLKLYAACFLHSNMENSSIDFLAVAHELEANTGDPKKAVHAMRERLRKARLKLPGSEALAAAKEAPAAKARKATDAPTSAKESLEKKSRKGKQVALDEASDKEA